MSDNKETIETIREMAKLSVLSNKINPIQEKNMKMFPLVFFNGVKSVTIDYDLSYKKTVDDEPVSAKPSVSYSIDLDETQANDFLDRRFEALETSIRNLFFKDTSIEVYFNGKIVYKSKK